MVQLDLEKAFDKVAHSILFALLEHINIGKVIQEGVRMAYADCSARLIINNKLSASIPVRSSVRQGCPASPLLFAIFLEPFCLKVLHNEKINGFRLHMHEVKILSYADDIAIFVATKTALLRQSKMRKCFVILLVVP